MNYKDGDSETLFDITVTLNIVRISGSYAQKLYNY